MKKILSCAFISLFVFTVTSQNIYMPKVKLDKIICKEWNVEFATLAGMKMRKLSDGANFDLLIETNGMYNLTKVTGEIRQGHWVYNVDKKYVLLFVENNIFARIKAVNNAEMILNLEEENNSALSNLDIHLKPI